MKNEFEIISKIFKQVINNRSLCSLIAYLYCREYKYTACLDVTSTRRRNMSNDFN